MELTQCLVFLESKVGPTDAAENHMPELPYLEQGWSAVKRYILFPSDYKNHHVSKTLEQGGLQVQIHPPENSRFTFFEMLVNDKSEFKRISVSVEAHHVYDRYFDWWLGEMREFHSSCTEIFNAVDENSLSSIEKIFSQGADIQYGHPGGGTILHFAVKKGHMALTKLLLKHGANPNARTNDRSTALHIAARRNNVMIVNLLLQNNADQNAVISEGAPLHIAVEKNSLEMVKLFVGNGADLSVRNDDCLTPLLVAVRKGHVEIVEHMLHFTNNENKQRLDAKLLRMAILYERTEVIALLLANGVSVNAELDNGGNALSLAVRLSRLEICEVLVRYGPDVNQSGNRAAFYDALSSLSGQKYQLQQMTACLLKCGFDINADDVAKPRLLFGAVSQNLHKTVKKLLDFGASLNQFSEFRGDKLTPLHEAARYADGDMIQLLLDHGADINATVGDSFCKHTPLSEAIEYSNLKTAEVLLVNNADVKYPPSLLHSAIIKCPQVLELLLINGANVNLKNSKGRTPLHEAAVSADGDVIQLLLNYGANIDAAVERSSPKQTPLSEAIERSNVESAKALLTKGASVKDPPGLLHLAIRKCSSIVQSLLESGVDVNSHNIKGQTPIVVAALEGIPKVFDVLMKFGAYGLLREIGHDYVCSNSFCFQEFLDYSFTNLDRSNNIHFPICHYSKRFSDTNDCAEMIAFHIIKVEAAYDSVGPRIRRKLYDELKLIDLKKNCESEIAAMKFEVIPDTKISFYNILTENTDRISCYARNEAFLRTLETFNIPEKFPIYASIIKCQIRKGTWRRQVLNTGIKLLNFLFRRCPKLPDELRERIVSYLSNQDILILQKCLNINMLAVSA